MSPYWHDDFLTVYQGDCREVMRSMEPESVHCVVTSPPYWGLRDYGTATWEGGDEGCDHLRPVGGAGKSTLALTGHPQTPEAERRSQEAQRTPYFGTCGKCGARRIDNQLGLEATPEEYVANMVAVFREVRRVLRADGTVWLNLGDSYASGGGSDVQRLDVLGERLGTGGGHKHSSRPSGRAPSAGLAQKQLVGIPWRVAFALQADGWYLRSDIIWSKPNPMPESVTDRPTKSHEYLFLLSKSPRYYYDADAVRLEGYGGDNGRAYYANRGLPQPASNLPKHTGTGQPRDGGNGGLLGTPKGGANLRSVWNIATQPYPGAHFATFPRKLVEPCIKAGTSERGVCPECGAPWVRVVERNGTSMDHWSDRWHQGRSSVGRHGPSRPGGFYPDTQTTGWRPDCLHHHDDGKWLTPAPATVLDPFAGSGTTALVAQALGRRAVLIDLSTDYLDQIMRRNAQLPLGA